MLAVPLLVVVTRGHEDPVAWIGSVDRGLDGLELSSDAPESPHPQDAVVRLARRLAAILLLSEPWRAAGWSLPPVSGLSGPSGEDRGEEGQQGEVGELAYPVTSTRGQASARAHQQGPFRKNSALVEHQPHGGVQRNRKTTRSLGDMHLPNASQHEAGVAGRHTQQIASPFPVAEGSS